MSNLPGKTASESDFIGQDGINLISTIVAKMRHLWTATTAHSDKGIDGYIDICSTTDQGKRISTNFIIQVQSKATDGLWSHEDDSGFDFRVDERDLAHWLSGSTPVILIVSRPRTGEAYWISIKDYFSSLEAKKTRTIYFKKSIHRFDENTELALQRLSIPASSGFKTQPLQKNEALTSNLLPLLNHPEFIYSRKTRFKSLDAIRKKARTLGGYTGRAWFYKGGKVFGFRPFDQQPWSKLTTGNPLDPIRSEKWGTSNDPVCKRDFVRLLNEALAGFLAARGLRRCMLPRRRVLYYFAPISNDVERVEKWGARDVERNVIQRILSKKEPNRTVCFRHHAIIPHFDRFGDKWFLILEPTYYFTFDGEKESSYREEYLSGIKRLEKNQAVANNVRFWADFLNRSDLFEKRNDMFVFGQLLQFSTEFGIPDADWLSHADAEELDRLIDVDEESGKKLVADGNQLSFTHEAGTNT